MAAVQLRAFPCPPFPLVNGDAMKSADSNLLIVEDNERFAEALAADFRDRAYEVFISPNLEGLQKFEHIPIHFAIVDLRLRADNGMDAIPIIRAWNPETKIVVLTGYGSIATAVQATKNGADGYLTKPVDIAMIENAFRSGNSAVAQAGDKAPGQEYPSLARNEREYIEYVLAECDGNISEAARRLGLHRQSLQRKLRKHTPK